MPRRVLLQRARTKYAALYLSAALFATAGLLTNARPRNSLDNKTPDAADAKRTFEAVCASCHGLDGRGGERGPDLVGRAETSSKSDAELRAILEKGRPATGMPSFANYGPERLAALVDYLRTLQGRGITVKLPGNPERGKTLFFGKAKCADCHMVGGKGGFWGQDLTKYGGKREANDIRAAILNPDKDRDPRRGLVTVVLNDSRRVSGLVRNEDNFSLQLQTADGAFHLLNKADLQKMSYEGRSGMPMNYGSMLSANELNDLVSFLLHTAGTEKKQTGDSDDDFEE